MLICISFGFARCNETLRGTFWNRRTTSKEITFLLFDKLNYWTFLINSNKYFNIVQNKFIGTFQMLNNYQTWFLFSSDLRGISLLIGSIWISVVFCEFSKFLFNIADKILLSAKSMVTGYYVENLIKLSKQRLNRHLR